MDVWTYKRMDGVIKGWIDDFLDVEEDGWRDGWMD